MRLSLASGTPVVAGSTLFKGAPGAGNAGMKLANAEQADAHRRVRMRPRLRGCLCARYVCDSLTHVPARAADLVIASNRRPNSGYLIRAYEVEHSTEVIEHGLGVCKLASETDIPIRPHQINTATHDRICGMDIASLIH